MKKLITILLLIIALPAFSQYKTGGANTNSDDPIDDKAGKGTEIIANKFGFEKVSALRLMNYEKTSTGDLVIKGKNGASQDNSIEENFDRNNNVCPNGQCGSNLFLWGAVSVAAGILSVVMLKSK